MLSSLVVWLTLVGWAHAKNYNPGDQEVAFNIDNPTDTMDFYWEDITKYDSPEEKGKLARLSILKTLNIKVLWDACFSHEHKQVIGVPSDGQSCWPTTQWCTREDFGGIEHDPNVKFICEEVDQADKTPFDRRASDTKSTSIVPSAEATSTISTNSTSTTSPSSFVSPLNISFFANQESLFQPKNPDPEKPEPEVSTWWIEVTKPEVDDNEPDKPITKDQPEDKDGSKGLGKMIFTHLHPAGRQYLWQKKPADPNDETVRISVCDFDITADPLVDEIYFWVDNFTVQGYKDGVFLEDHPVSDAYITNVCNTISGEEAENKKGDRN